jgi:hypothetical protein
MYSGRGKLFPGAALADQNYRTERTGNTRNLLLKPKEHFARTERFVLRKRNGGTQNSGS